MNKKEVGRSACMAERERSLGKVGSVWDHWVEAQLFPLNLLDDLCCFGMYESSIQSFTEDGACVLLPILAFEVAHFQRLHHKTVAAAIFFMWMRAFVLARLLTGSLALGLVLNCGFCHFIAI